MQTNISHRTVNINIAGFNIMIVLRDYDDPHAIAFYKELKHIAGMLFTADNTLSKAHFIIYIIRDKQPFAIEHKNNEFFIKIASQKVNQIFTTYNIGIPQFLILVFQALLYCMNESKNAAFLHSSGIIYQKKVILFLGESTAGKSTVVKLLQKSGVTAYCDDMSIITRSLNKFYSYPASIFENNPYPTSQVPHQIHKIFLIQKGDVLSINKIQVDINYSQIYRNIHKQLDIAKVAYKEDFIESFIKANKNKFHLLTFPLRILTSEETEQILQSK